MFLLNFFTPDILNITSWLFLYILLSWTQSKSFFFSLFLARNFRSPLLKLLCLRDTYAQCMKQSDDVVQLGIKLLFRILKIYASSEIIVACMITLYVLCCHHRSLVYLLIIIKCRTISFHDNLHFIWLHSAYIQIVIGKRIPFHLV